MDEIDLLVQGHFLEHQFCPLIRRKTRVHPRTILLLLVLLAVRMEPCKNGCNDQAKREYCSKRKDQAAWLVHVLGSSCEIKFTNAIISVSRQICIANENASETFRPRAGGGFEPVLALTPTRFQSTRSIVTNPGSPFAYHKKLLHSRSFGCSTSPRCTGFACMYSSFSFFFSW